MKKTNLKTNLKLNHVQTLNVGNGTFRYVDDGKGHVYIPFNDIQNARTLRKLPVEQIGLNAGNLRYNFEQRSAFSKMPVEEMVQFAIRANANKRTSLLFNGMISGSQLISVVNVKDYVKVCDRLNEICDRELGAALFYNDTLELCGGKKYTVLDGNTMIACLNDPDFLEASPSLQAVRDAGIECVEYNLKSLCKKGEWTVDQAVLAAMIVLVTAYNYEWKASAKKDYMMLVSKVFDRILQKYHPSYNTIVRMQIVTSILPYIFVAQKISLKAIQIGWIRYYLGSKAVPDKFASFDMVAKAPFYAGVKADHNEYPGKEAAITIEESMHYSAEEVEAILDVYRIAWEIYQKVAIGSDEYSTALNLVVRGDEGLKIKGLYLKIRNKIGENIAENGMINTSIEDELIEPLSHLISLANDIKKKSAELKKDTVKMNKQLTNIYQKEVERLLKEYNKAAKAALN